MRSSSSITTMADELPQEIIQLIQSMIQSSHHFEGKKEAARTSLVSKSWYRAWSMRPDLVFDQCYFRSGDDLFWELAKTTMKRYEDLNINIRSLGLVMMNDVIAKKLVVKAIKLGVVLPDEVLQSQTLARLNLSGPWDGFFTINLSPEVTCYNLKSLKLECVSVINGDLFRDLIMRCRLIEKFTLSSVNDTSTSRSIMDREIGKLHDYLPKLKYLSLEVECTLPRHVLWDQFASLKELKISYDNYDGDDDGDYDHDLRIRIPSLERICLTLSRLCNDIMSVKFDFPNIRKFKLKGPLPRRFELKTNTTRRDQWKSKIDIEYEPPSNGWFSRLSQFVRMLNVSRSRVSLSISVDVYIQDEDEFRYYGDGLGIPTMKKLKLRGDQTVTPAFLDGIFWCCRPKFVEIQNECLFGLNGMNVEEFQQLRSLPWETFYHVSSNKHGYDVCFQVPTQPGTRAVISSCIGFYFMKF